MQPAVFQTCDKAVILSEALRRNIANRGRYGAKPKDLGDACWQMLLGAFRPQTTTQDKKVTNSERRTPRVLIFLMLFGAFQPLKPAPGEPATSFPWAERCYNLLPPPLIAMTMG
jgi:hypothetical protein